LLLRRAGGGRRAPMCIRGRAKAIQDGGLAWGRFVGRAFVFQAAADSKCYSVLP
jgi:hypothetical protein